MKENGMMDIFGNLRLCFNLLHRGGERQRHCRGGFRGRGRVLAFLREHDGISQREMAESLGIRAPSVSELLERLVDEGLVERRVNEADRRFLKVFLTEKGAKMADQVGHNRRQEADGLLEAFSGEERRQFAALLEKLVVALQERTALPDGDGELVHGHGHGGHCGCGGHGGHARGGCHCHADSGEAGRDGPEENGFCGCTRRHGRQEKTEV